MFIPSAPPIPKATSSRHIEKKIPAYMVICLFCEVARLHCPCHCFCRFHNSNNINEHRLLKKNSIDEQCGYSIIVKGEWFACEVARLQYLCHCFWCLCNFKYISEQCGNYMVINYQLASIWVKLLLSDLFVKSPFQADIAVTNIVNAMLIRATGQNLQMEYIRSLKLLDHVKLLEKPEIIPSGDIAALVYLWNPFTIVACVGLSTSPIENLAIILSLYGACKRKAPLAAFGWVIATHLSLYPAILIIPMILLLGYGPDTPPRKLFLQRRNVEVGDNPPNDRCCEREEVVHRPEVPHVFSWRPVIHFLCWTSLWSVYVLVLCGISVKQYGGLWELFKRTYGFMLTVQDLSPNIGVLWYFFAEVFDFFRNFFLIVFHGNILFMMLPLAIRLKHRPCFLAFVYIAISSMLKCYPSVGDSALYLGLLGLFVNELADMQFSFFLFCGYVGVSLLSPVMHNLWIWRGTGNANFYFATAMAYACLQIILVVESVSAMLNHDRTLRKPLTELQDGKS